MVNRADRFSTALASMTHVLKFSYRRLAVPTRATVVGIVLMAGCVVGAFATSASTAVAQQIQRIAAVVNDEVISIFDVSERIELVISSSGLENSREQRQRLAPQVLRSLIDERLQTQEAKRLNIQVTKRDLDEAVSRIEATNRIPKGKFGDFLQRQGVSRDAAMKQIEVELAWQKLLARRVVPAIEIGEEEIDAIVARINATRDTAQYHVSEILLTVDDPNEQAQTRELAKRLVSQIRSGAEFAAVARQFSKSATAATGGDIGWVQEGQIEGSVTKILEKLAPGEISDPVETPDGFVVFRLDGKRRSAAPGEDDRQIALRQVLLQIARDTPESDVSAQMEKAQQITGKVKGCEDFIKSAEQLGVKQPAAPTRIRIGDLNDKLREIVDGLEVGQASKPLRSVVGIQIVMVCERSEVAGAPRDETRELLMRQRIDLRARRYLRDLRRAAFVDLRI